MRIGLIRLILPDSLEYLIAKMPSLEDLPCFESKTEAGKRRSIREVRTQMIDSPQITQMKHLNTQGKQIAHGKKLLRPTLAHQLKEYVPLKLSIILTVLGINGNFFLHILAMYPYQPFAIFKRLTPSFLNFDNNKVPLKLVMTVENEHADNLQRQHINNMTVLTKQQLSQLQPALIRKSSIMSMYK